MHPRGIRTWTRGTQEAPGNPRDMARHANYGDTIIDLSNPVHPNRTSVMPYHEEH